MKKQLFLALLLASATIINAETSHDDRKKDLKEAIAKAYDETLKAHNDKIDSNPDQAPTFEQNVDNLLAKTKAIILNDLEPKHKVKEHIKKDKDVQKAKKSKK